MRAENVHPLSPPVSEPSGAAASRAWSIESLSGRLAELSAGPQAATLSLAFRLVLEAQANGEPTAWITEEAQSFFPPDAARTGVDLEALAVVRLPSAEAAPRAADLLLRSGGFGLIVLDLGSRARLSLAVQTRLAGLARKHGTALLFLTEKPRQAPSLGPLISVRAEAVRTGTREPFACEVRPLKDKRSGASWRHTEPFHAPDGLY